MKNKPKITQTLKMACIMLLMTLAYTQLHAQQKLKYDDLIERNRFGDTYFKAQGIKNLPYTHPDSFFMCYKYIFGLNEDHEIIRTGVTNNNNNFFRYFYQQYYKGIPVEAERSTSIDYKNNIPTDIQLIADTTIHIENTEPAITTQQAIEATKKAVKAETGRIIKYPQNFFITDTNLIANLVFYKKNKQYLLCYKAQTIVFGPLNSFDVFINAKTGETVDLYSTTSHQFDPDPFSEPSPFCEQPTGYIKNTITSANILYYANSNDPIVPAGYYPNITASGVQHSFNVQQYTSSLDANIVYKLKDDSIKKTLRMGRPFIMGSDTLLSEYCYKNSDEPLAIVANTGFWGLQKCYDYFAEKHNWINWNNLPYAKTSLVIELQNEANVAAYGKQLIISIGQGSGNPQVSPKVSLDAVTHEYTHGIIYSKGVKEKLQGERGAVVEGICDVFGMIVEGNHTPINWQVEETFSPNLYRDHANPWLSKPPQPNAYRGEHWDTATANKKNYIHHNNSVLGHWFYLLAKGGMGNVNGEFTPDKTYDVKGIGIDTAAQILFKSLDKFNETGDTVKTYPDFARKTLKVTKDIYGDCSPVYLAAANAWHAVNINASKMGILITCVGYQGTACHPNPCIPLPNENNPYQLALKFSNSNLCNNITFNDITEISINNAIGVELNQILEPTLYDYKFEVDDYATIIDYVETKIVTFASPGYKTITFTAKKSPNNDQCYSISKTIYVNDNCTLNTAGMVSVTNCNTLTLNAPTHPLAPLATVGCYQIEVFKNNDLLNPVAIYYHSNNDFPVSYSLAPNTTYTLQFTDPVTGCTATETVSTKAPKITAAAITQPNNYQPNNGSISPTVTQGTAPYSYLWSNGATTPAISGLTAGNYSLTVTDANGCTVTKSTQLKQKSCYLKLIAAPNPFPNSTSLQFEFVCFEIEKTGIRVALYNQNGQLLNTLYNNDIDANTLYNIPCNLSNYPAGVYFVVAQFPKLPNEPKQSIKLLKTN